MAELKSQKIEIRVHRNLYVFSFCLGVSRGVHYVRGEDEGGGGLLGVSILLQTMPVRCKKGRG